MSKKLSVLFVLLFVIGPILTACAAPAPQVVQKVVTVEVVKNVPQTVEVPKEVVVTKEVQKDVVKARPKLTMWVDHFFFSPATDAMFKSQALQFAQQNGFDLEYVQDSPDVMLPRESAALESKGLPDILYTDVAHLSPVVNAGQAQDVSDVVATLNKNMGGFTPGMMAAVTLDGKQWAVPYAMATEEFYVRKDILDKMGMKYPQTWEDAFAIGLKANNPPTVWGMGIQLGNNYDTENQLNAMLWGYGGSVFSADGMAIALDSPATRQILDMIKKSWDAGTTPKDVLTGDESWNNKVYQSGKVVMIQNTGSVAKWMAANDPDLLKNTTLGAPPAGPKGRFVSATGVAILIPNYSKNLALAKGMVQYLESPTIYKALLTEMQGFRMPAFVDTADMKLWADPLMKPLQANVPFSFLPGYPGPATPSALQAYNQKVLAAMVGHVLADGWSNDKAIADAVAKLQTIVTQTTKT
jgi:ABC-type glycerol-3-phosphate transport system substrate-binding protein